MAKITDPDILFHPKVIERFVDKLELGQNGCVEYSGRKDENGYGRIHIGGKYEKQEVIASRYAYQLALGGVILPSEIQVCHHCDNPACVMPTHLFPGTNQDNVDDRVRKGRSASNVTNAKLTSEIVSHIREINMPLKQIMENYHVSKSTASYARSGKTWK